MNKSYLVGLAVIPSLLYSCSNDSNNAAVKDGLCTSATVSAYNQVSYSAQRLSTYSTEATLLDIQKACTNYRNLIANSSCKLDLSGVETTVNRGSRDNICVKVDQAINELRQPKQTTQPTVTPAQPVASGSSDERQYLLLMTDKLEITVLKSEILLRPDLDVTFFQDGKAKTKNTFDVDANRAACTIVTTGVPLNDGETKFVMDTFKSDVDGKYVTLTLSSDRDASSSSYTQITCVPGRSKSAMLLSLNDLKQAFGNVLDIKVIKAARK